MLLFIAMLNLVALPCIKPRVQFHASIPQTELDYYFGQPLATTFSEKLHQALDLRLAELSTEHSFNTTAIHMCIAIQHTLALM